MRNKYLPLLFLLAFLYTKSNYAQQLTVDKTISCYGSFSYFSIPPFVLPPSTNIESYTFFIGADTITSTENEHSIWFEPGTYAASASVKLSNGNIIPTNTLSVKIIAPPIAGFSVTGGDIFCLSDSVCIINTSTQTDFPISKVRLSFGEDAVSNEYNSNIAGACYRYHFSSTFLIGLSVTDSFGCSSDTGNWVIIKQSPDPSVDWNGTPGCSGSTYRFTNFLAGGFTPPTIQSYTWNFGDGQTYSATAPFTNTELRHLDTITHYYTADGVFTPSFSITDTNGCSVVSKNYVNKFSLPANIVTAGKIHSSATQNGPDEQVFCLSTPPVFFAPPASSFPFAQNWGSGIWDFSDPMSMQQNTDRNPTPQHTFIAPGPHIVKLDLSNDFPNCIFYDTIEMVGPVAKIENINQGITVDASQKYQISGTDTVDFVNTTANYGVTHKINFVWDFDDKFAPACTAYSVPKAGALLPFNTAKEQYDNSDHYYIMNGITSSGKMNCRWSIDSLPRHTYTNWDSVYSWYIQGKTFPPSWGVNPIQPNSNIHFLQLVDPFLLAQGKVVMLPGGNISSPTGFYSYTGPDGNTIIHNGTDVLPNSTQTFYQYLFYNGIARNYNPRLTAFDPLGKGCLSFDHVVLKFGKPDAHRFNVGGKQCAGRFPDGSIYFDFSSLNHSTVLINFDSLADRKDATPCTIDGFVDFQGGITPGGLNRLPFFSEPNYLPTTVWTNSANEKLYYHFGPNAPFNTPAPADSVNGNVTVGIIVGSGCANPPFCTQPAFYSDTLWFHNILQVKQPNPQFDLVNEGKLFSKKEKITVKPLEAYQPALRYDTWIWGDGTATVDSFRYAAEQGLPDNTTNGYFTNGVRRVRYMFSIDTHSFVLSDSLPFPNGYPGINVRTDSISNNACSGNSKVYIVKDSALLLLPVSHVLNRSSFETSADPTYPLISMIQHYTSNTQGCSGVNIKPMTIGIIDSIAVKGNNTSFCAGGTVDLQGIARYFRCDNQNTSLPFTPNHSCATNTYYNPPYDALNYDTLDFWRVHNNQAADIKYIYFNTSTNKTDTVYYEKMYWDFGDGSPVVKGIAAKHQYTSAGNYTLRMITRDSVGSWDTCSKIITVGGTVAKIGLPKQSFPPFAPRTIFNCTDSVLLIDSSNTADTAVTNYWWFGDERDSIDWQLRDQRQVIHKYTANGSFRIKLVSVNDQGCISTATENIFITGPRPYFRVISPNAGCAPFTVKLVNDADAKRKYTSGGGPFPNDTPTATTYFDMGDGISPQIVALRHDTIQFTYTTSGRFLINSYGSDAPPGMPNACPLVIFPDGKMDTSVWITVYDNATNGIVGKNKVAVSETGKYSVARTSNAIYSWTVTGGTITGSSTIPTVSVTWSAVDGRYRLICTKTVSGCSTVDTLEVVVGTPPVGVKETILGVNNIIVFPNPAHGQFTVKLKTTAGDPVQVSLYDLVGKSHLTETITPGATMERIFDVHYLKAGIYFIEIQSQDETYIHKLLIE